MATTLSKKPKKNPFNILLIGNNPRELSSVYNLLKKIKKREFITDIAFDLKNIFLRIARFRPNFILIDDALNKRQIKKLLNRLRRNKKTQDIPIAVLKSSNYNETLNEGVSDFILKENMSSDSLYHSILNSIRFHKTYRYLRYAYRKRAWQLTKFFKRRKIGL